MDSMTRKDLEVIVLALEKMRGEQIGQCLLLKKNPLTDPMIMPTIVALAKVFHLMEKKDKTKTA